MSIRVSVVIPTYKSAAWVEATLESVIAQTYPADSFEIIVIDDASPDDSANIARRFLQRHPIRSRVVVLENNVGPAAARNYGWHLAIGDWIQFLDADDILAPHKIELQARTAFQAEENVAVVYSNWQHLTQDDGRWQGTGSVNAPFVDDDPVVQILQEPTFGYVGPTLIRKSFLVQTVGFGENPNIGEDLDLMLRLGMIGAEFRQVHSEKVAFLYRQWPNSLWRSYIKDVAAMRNLLHTIRAAESFLRARSPNGVLSKDARSALAMRYWKFAKFYLENDPTSFQLITAHLKGLRRNRFFDFSGGLEFLSGIIGHEYALRLASIYHNFRFLLKFRLLRRGITWVMPILIASQFDYSSLC